jgi:hypothetical protein
MTCAELAAKLLEHPCAELAAKLLEHPDTRVVVEGFVDGFEKDLDVVATRHYVDSETGEHTIHLLTGELVHG